MTSETLTFQVQNLRCASCITRIENLLNTLPNIDEVVANLTTKFVHIKGTNLTARDICDQLNHHGFPTVIQSIRITDIETSQPPTDIRQAIDIASIPGVISATWDHAQRSGELRTLDGLSAVNSILSALANTRHATRYTMRRENTPVERKDEQQTLKWETLLAGLLTLPVFGLEMGSHVIPSFHDWLMDNFETETLYVLQFLLASAVLGIPGRMIVVDGLRSLWGGLPDMNSLVALGTVSAWSFSTISAFAPHLVQSQNTAVYFEAVLVIITLVLLGRFIEARTKEKVGTAVQKLLQLTSNTATIQRSGISVEVPVDEIRVGDIVLAKPGERIAIDGRVIDGTSFVDESMMSGEPKPRLKTVNERVVGGTLNGAGSLRYVATHLSSQTTLSRIIRMVEEAQLTRLPVENFVNQITRWFVPTVLALALATLLVWLLCGASLSVALVAGVSVLIIACPCAMGLAVPTAIMVGIGRAAEIGVLFRKGEAVQRLSEITTIAFDKTGTLTQGQPELIHFSTIQERDHDNTLALIAAVESLSEHPVAFAIQQEAKRQRLHPHAVTRFVVHVGLGVSGTVNYNDIVIGSHRLMSQHDINVEPLHKAVTKMAEQGVSPIYAAIDGEIAAVLGVEDPLKNSARKTINELKKLGLKVAMITGDDEQTAHRVAQELQIENVIAQVLPDGKVDALKTLHSKNEKFAFVGDGINDAPALSSAAVGIAIGSGTDIAVESADVILSSNDLNAVVRMFVVSRTILRTIRQNLFWAFGYNVILIPVAAGALYPVTGLSLSPELAALAMALSSTTVIANSLRLRYIYSTLSQ